MNNAKVLSAVLDAMEAHNLRREQMLQTSVEGRDVFRAMAAWKDFAASAAMLVQIGRACGLNCVASRQDGLISVNGRLAE